MVAVQLTVGKVDASLALLLTKSHHLVELPTVLLPPGIRPGTVLSLNCEIDEEAQLEQQQQFERVQEDIYNAFAKYEPQAPVLALVNATQTACVLTWGALQLGTAELLSLVLYKNGQRMTSIKAPLGKRSIKLSGLPVDTAYKFQLKMETTSGVYMSNVLDIRTHKMTDLSGINVCIGEIDYSNEKFTREELDEMVTMMGAKPLHDQVRVDTTQFVCTNDEGIQYQAAKEANIPIVRPEWLRACLIERRIVGVSKFYLDAEKPLWKERDFWAIPVSEVPEEPEPEIQNGDVISNVVDKLENHSQINDSLDDIPKDSTKSTEPEENNNNTLENDDEAVDKASVEPVVSNSALTATEEPPFEEPSTVEEPVGEDHISEESGVPESAPAEALKTQETLVEGVSDDQAPGIIEETAITGEETVPAVETDQPIEQGTEQIEDETQNSAKDDVKPEESANEELNEEPTEPTSTETAEKDGDLVVEGDSAANDEMVAVEELVEDEQPVATEEPVADEEEDNEEAEADESITAESNNDNTTKSNGGSSSKNKKKKKKGKK